jgi:hypothetical protein
MGRGRSPEKSAAMRTSHRFLAEELELRQEEVRTSLTQYETGIFSACALLAEMSAVSRERLAVSRQLLASNRQAEAPGRLATPWSTRTHPGGKRP